MTQWLAYFTAPLTWICFIFGAVVGSFLNVCIYRIPEGNFWQHARSVCRSCGRPIPMWFNIPILSWFLLRGKASCCRAKLPLQYPIVELLTAIFFVLSYWHVPFVGWYGDQIAFDTANILRFAHLIVFGSLLIVCSFIDLRHMIIPDVISLPMVVVSPIMAWIHPDLSLQSSLMGVALGGGVLYLIAWIYWLVRKEVGMGFGDVKLLAAIGGWLGYQAVLPTIFYGSIIGALVGIAVLIYHKERNLKLAIPFGPFLALGALIHLLYGGWVQEYLFYTFGTN